MDRNQRAEEIAARINFFGISRSDYAQFPAIAKSLDDHAPTAMTAFYGKIGQTAQLSHFFSSQQAMNHARDKQLGHWQQLFARPLDEGYFQRAERIGNVHAQIGLKPTWYIGGYALVLERVIQAIVNESLVQRLNGKQMGKKISTLVKLALLDMDVALSAYFHAEEGQRLAVIDQFGSALSELAKGDFTSELGELPEAFAQIEKDFEYMREKISETLAQVSVTADSINTGSVEIAQASDDLSIRTEQQAASLEQTAAAMDQLTSGVREAAEGAAHVKNSVEEAHHDAAQGGAVVKEAVKAMDDIHRSAQEITQITNVIDGIAFQTNLLALNAGVEAARAGDAGKGFAVVANEVRALAQRSAEAAKHIKDLISASSQQVERGVALVGQSGESLDRIVDRIGYISQLAGNISQLAGTQANSLQQINVAVGEMDKMTQQNAAMVEQSTAAARSLANEASQLAGLVGHFNLANTTRSISYQNGLASMAAPVPSPSQSRFTTSAQAPRRGNAVTSPTPTLGRGRPAAQPAQPAQSAAPQPIPALTSVGADDDWSEF